jgi:hypothetical protein
VAQAKESRPGLSALADDLLASSPLPFLGGVGRASAAVYDEIGNETLTQPFLTAVYWHGFVRTPSYGRALGEVTGADHGVAQADRVIVVHSGGERFDLLVLVPGFEGSPQAVGANAEPNDLLRVLATSTVPSAALATIRTGIRFPGPSPSPPPDNAVLLATAAAELSTAVEFGMIVAGAPEIEFLASAPSPAVPVGTAANPDASLGVIHTRADGTVVATTASHAVSGNAQVQVGTAIGTVVGRDPVSDSCLLELDHDPSGGIRSGLAGASIVRPPRQYLALSFDGATSGAGVATTLHGYDDTILDPQPYLQTKLYTSPDTNPGDSGAALIDPATDTVMGFAMARTSLSSPVVYSLWVWAEDVFAAHGL